MKTLPQEQLGSWHQAVVNSDGVWHTRGHFSKNGSFIIKNYLTGGLLWYGYKCMRGKDDVVEDEIGTLRYQDRELRRGRHCKS